MLFVRGLCGDGAEVFFLQIALFAPATQESAGSRLCGGQGSDIDSVALVRGIIDSPPFQVILEKMERAGPCLCQYYVRTLEEAVRATAAIRDFLRYFSSESFARSRAFERIRRALTTPLPPLATRRDVARYPPEVRAAHAACRAAGVDFAYCRREERVWFARTPKASNLLRRVARRLKQKGGTLRVKPPEVHHMVFLVRPTQILSVSILHQPLSVFWECLENGAENYTKA